MKLEQIVALTHEELVEYILKARRLSKRPIPSGEVWQILPPQIMELLTCVQTQDAQVGDFIILRANTVEKKWALAVERVREGDWIPILIGSTEVGEGIVISYNRRENYCIEPINLVRGGTVMQGEVIALTFDGFLRLNLVLDAIKSEDLFDDDGKLNPEGHQRLEAALKIFYPDFAKSNYWLSWLGWE